jgi:hypothetical protein
VRISLSPCTRALVCVRMYPRVEDYLFSLSSDLNDCAVIYGMHDQNLGKERVPCCKAATELR